MVIGWFFGWVGRWLWWWLWLREARVSHTERFWGGWCGNVVSPTRCVYGDGITEYGILLSVNDGFG